MDVLPWMVRPEEQSGLSARAGKGREAEGRDSATRQGTQEVVMVELDETDLQSLQIWARRILVNAYAISLKNRFQDFLGESAFVNKLICTTFTSCVNHLNGSVYSLTPEGGGRC